MITKYAHFTCDVSWCNSYADREVNRSGLFEKPKGWHLLDGIYHVCNAHELVLFFEIVKGVS